MARVHPSQPCKLAAAVLRPLLLTAVLTSAAACRMDGPALGGGGSQVFGMEIDRLLNPNPEQLQDVLNGLQLMSLTEFRDAALGNIAVGTHVLEDGTEIDMTAVAEQLDANLSSLGTSFSTVGDLLAAIEAKQSKNEGRRWPDWRTAPADRAIEHDRSDEGAPQ